MAFGRSICVALGALALVGSGCVSADMHERVRKESEANKTAYLAADAVVGNLKQKIQALELKNAAMEKDLAVSRERGSASDLVVAAKYEDLKKKYEDMIENLRGEDGGELPINRETGGVVLEDSVYFNPGMAALKSDKFKSIDNLIGQLRSKEFSSYTIEIAGHTDSDPITKSKWDSNFSLAAARAHAVLVYFQKNGIGADRVYISGYGPTKPRSDKKADNRRVEIVLHERT